MPPGYNKRMTVPVPAPIARLAPDGKLTVRQKRRLLLDMALRRVRPGTGSSHEFMLRRTAMIEWPDLRNVLQGIEWVIVGGVATRAYMPERGTKDLDILVRRADEETILDRLIKAGYKVITPLAVPGYLLLSPEGIEVDVLLGDYPWLKLALKEMQQDAAGYPVIDLPYLVLMKLSASRPQDVADLSRMLGWADENMLERVRQIVARYSPQDVEDLESLIFLGQQERLDPDNRL